MLFVRMLTVIAIVLPGVVSRAIGQPITGDLAILNVTTSPTSVLSGGSVQVNFGTINNGPGTAQISGYVVRVDGVVKINRTNILTTSAVGQSRFYQETVSMPTVPNGTTTSFDVEVQINEVGNINTSNNTDTAFVTVSNPLPDLSCTTPSGWSGPLVLSTVPGTNTTAPVITDQDTIYLDFAVKNLGGSMQSGGVSMRGTLDGTIDLGIPTPLPTMLSDATDARVDTPLGPLAPGNHTILIEIDYLHTVPESNENNNQCQIQFFVEPSTPDVDLAPYAPTDLGWPAPLFATDAASSVVPVTVFDEDQPVYVYGAFGNYGTDPAGLFQINLLVDGFAIANGDYTLGALEYDYFGVGITGLTPGQHDISYELDTLFEVDETNESNNSASISIQVTAPPCPPDFNDDGVVDNGDIGAFVSTFLAGDFEADFNGDGVLDNGDIGAFVAAFLAGC